MRLLAATIAGALSCAVAQADERKNFPSIDGREGGILSCKVFRTSEDRALFQGAEFIIGVSIQYFEGYLTRIDHMGASEKRSCVDNGRSFYCVRPENSNSWSQLDFPDLIYLEVDNPNVSFMSSKCQLLDVKSGK